MMLSSRSTSRLLIALATCTVLHLPARAETSAELGRRFFSMLWSDAAELKARPYLSERTGLVTAADLARRQEWDPALLAFRDYYLGKLAQPPASVGFPPATLDPAVDYNGAFKAVVTADPKVRAGAIAAADRLLKGQGGPKGQVGALDWSAGDFWNGAFANPLLEAFVYTQDGRYLKTWCDFMDDWALHENYLARRRPLYMQPGDSKGHFAAFQIMRLLRAVALAPAEKRDELRADTLARVLAKLVTYYPFINDVYHRSNARNWNMESAYLNSWLGAIWDEFRMGEYYSDRGRTIMERYGSTHVLPDGAEVQHMFGYNFMYLADGDKVTTLVDSLYPQAGLRPAWKEALVRRHWTDEQRELVRSRARYLLRMTTADRTLPIGMRGDFRSTDPQAMRAHAPSVMAEPDSVAVLNALNKRPVDGALPSASDTMPWAGYYWQREGWTPGSGYAFMISVPVIGDNGFLGRCCNNAFGLRMYGMDLMDIGVDGPYSIRPCPLLVDGQPQNFNAGVFDTEMEPTGPITSRWFTSSRFDLAEAVYRGPYAPNIRPDDARAIGDQYEKSIRDVAHQRQLIFLKEARLWLCADRLLTAQSHAYELVWRLPGPPASKPQVKTFDPAKIRVDAEHGAVHTEADGQPNLSLYHVGSSPLHLAVRAPKRPRPTKLTVLTDVPVTWKGSGEQVVATLVHPRPNRATKLARCERVDQPQALGFSFATADGVEVEFRVSRHGEADMAAGGMAARGELLLVQKKQGRVSGLALGCRSLRIDGREVALIQPDVSFEVAGGQVAQTAILGPLQPVEVGPARQGFAGTQEVTLTCATRGVELRYTLDGREVTPASTLYAGPFSIDRSTIVRARAYRPGLKENPTELDGRRASPPVWAYYEQLAPAPAVAVAAAVGGLWCDRYEGGWIEMMQNLDGLKPVERHAVTELFEKWEGVPAPEKFTQRGAETPTPIEKAPPVYGLRYSGYLEVPAAGVYTFRAPDHYIRDNLAEGYELVVKVAGKTWSPVMRRHALGTWTVALEKGTHPFEVSYVDFRGSAVADFYDPRLRINWIWPGARPPLTLTGPGLPEQPVPAAWLKRQPATSASR